jgi:hypothetical protein
MIDTLWWMAENEKKYDLLKKEEYKKYFATGRKEYQTNLIDRQELRVPGKAHSCLN